VPGRDTGRDICSAAADIPRGVPPLKIVEMIAPKMRGSLD
jgi:hypothetical protein